MEVKNLIENKYEELSDREIAKELDITESEVEKIRSENGFLRIQNFIDTENIEKNLEINFELDKMRKRQLQGFIGEKICSLMQNRVMEELEKHVKNRWILREKAHLLNEKDSSHNYWIGGRPSKDEIEIEGYLVKHFNADKENIKEKISSECLLADESLFRKFREVKNPWIDFNFYALKISDYQKKKFSVRDFSKNSFEEENKTIEVKVPVIEDFKVIALEVKTSSDKAEKLLSTNQRKVRENAKNSAFLEFFTLKIDTEFDRLDIPESFSATFQKHS